MITPVGQLLKKYNLGDYKNREILPKIHNKETQIFLENVRLVEKISYTGLPKKLYNKFSFENLNQSFLDPKKLEICEKWTPENEKGLLLIGSVGTAKTHIACAILKRFSNKNFIGKFYSLSKLMSECKDKIANNKDGDTIEMLLNDIYSCDILVIDDLGDSKTTDFSHDIFSGILNNRINTEKKIIITTNLSGDELREIYGRRILDRFNEIVRPVTFVGESFRKKVLSKKI